MKADHALTGTPFADSTKRVSRTLLGLILLAGMLAIGSGCRLCCDLEDQDYPAYGGAWERTNRSSGRVGSLFDPGGARASALAPRNKAGDGIDGRNRVAPSRDDAENELDNAIPPSDQQKKSDEETEQEFQDRLKKLQNDNNMLSAEVILGAPSPPQFR